MPPPTWFDESRLDDDSALTMADSSLRQLAESGARVRREAVEAESALAEAVAIAREQAPAPRGGGRRSGLPAAAGGPGAVVPGALRRLAEPGPAGVGRRSRPRRRARPRRGRRRYGVRRRGGRPSRLPGRRRGARPSRSSAQHAAGRWSSILPTTARDQLATAVLVLEYLDRVDLGPPADHEQVAEALDRVAMSCSPHRDIAVNPAKILAIALADANPVVWGGSVLAARAARRVAESIRRASGRTAIAGDAEHLLPVIERVAPRNVFDDPFADEPGDLRPVLVVLDDGADDVLVREQRGRLQAARRRARRPHRDRRRGRHVGGGALRLAAAERSLRRRVPRDRARQRLTATR